MDGALYEAGTVVESLQDTWARGSFNLSAFPALLKRTLKEGFWRERLVPQTGEVAKFDRFEQFVTAPPPEGLHTTIEQLRAVCQKDKTARDLIDKATQNPHGAHLPDVNNVNIRPAGNAEDYALRRLRSQRPDLHARVLANELSPHAAMLEAGFRRKTITVPLDPERAVAALRRHFGPDELIRIASALTE